MRGATLLEYDDSNIPGFEAPPAFPLSDPALIPEQCLSPFGATTESVRADRQSQPAGKSTAVIHRCGNNRF